MTDGFGRDVGGDGGHGLTVVDWQGYMANPVAAFAVEPPAGAVGPVRVTVTGTEPRLYFDLPSEAGPGGPSKRFDAKPGGATPVEVGVSPARATRAFETALRVDVVDARGGRWATSVPVHATCARAGPVVGPPAYPVTVDFSQDKTGFFDDAGRRATFDRAAQDWAFYLATPPLRTVYGGQEATPIFPPTAFAGDRRVANSRPYAGFLLYGYGIDTPAVRSSGQPSDGGFQTTAAGVRPPLRRSGGVEVETLGNYNRLGWIDVADDRWFEAANAYGTRHDLYSILHHEIGHALIFNAWYPRFRRDGVLDDPALAAYLGTRPRTDQVEHLAGVVDPASLRGAFGNEYGGRVPWGRWLITKTDLLVARSVGYALRPVDCLSVAAVVTTGLPRGRPGVWYDTAVRGTGAGCRRTIGRSPTGPCRPG